MPGSSVRTSRTPLLRHGPVELRLVEAPKPHLDVFLQPYQPLLQEAMRTQPARTGNPPSASGNSV